MLLDHRIAALCHELGDRTLHEIVDGAGRGSLLDALLDAVRTGAPDEELDNHLTLLDEVLIRSGVPGGLVPDPADLLSGIPPGYRPPYSIDHPHIEVWACPMKRCSRRVLVNAVIDGQSTSPEATVPRCRITGGPLQSERLPT